MEVLISVEQPGTDGDLTSLRGWLDSPGVSVPWELAPLPPADGTLGFGIDEICAILGAAEGLPSLIQWLKSWGANRQEAPQLKVTVVISSLPDDAAGDENDSEPDT